MTKYVVLSRTDDTTEGWETIATVEASSSEQAIRKTTALDSSGVYVAIPSRSWKPQKVSVKQREPIITITPA